MTATARSDIGAQVKPVREAWVQGRVQFCDDVRRQRRSRLGVCLLSHLGHPAGIFRRIQWPQNARREFKTYLYCILMRLESTSEPMRFLSRFLLTATLSLCAALQPSLEICTR